jgi:hypothetical protein
MWVGINGKQFKRKKIKQFKKELIKFKSWEFVPEVTAKKNLLNNKFRNVQ